MKEKFASPLAVITVLICALSIGYQEMRISKVQAQLSPKDSSLPYEENDTKSRSRVHLSKPYNTKGVTLATEELAQLLTNHSNSIFNNPHEVAKLLPDILTILEPLTRREAVDAINAYLAQNEDHRGMSLASVFCELYPFEILDSLPDDDPWSGPLAITIPFTIFHMEPAFMLKFLENRPLKNSEDQELLLKHGGERLLINDPEKGYAFLRASYPEALKSIGLSINIKKETALNLITFAAQSPDLGFQDRIVDEVLRVSHHNKDYELLDLVYGEFSNVSDDSASINEKLLKSAFLKEIKDPEQANEMMAFLEKHIPDTAAETTGEMVKAWMERDFNAAGEWIMTLEESPHKIRAIEIFIEEIAPIDPEAADAWRELLPEG